MIYVVQDIKNYISEIQQKRVLKLHADVYSNMYTELFHKNIWLLLFGVFYTVATWWNKIFFKTYIGTLNNSLRKYSIYFCLKGNAGNNKLRLVIPVFLHLVKSSSMLYVCVSVWVF